MIKANDLRIGNIIWHTRKNVDTNEIEDIETVVDGNLIKSLELHPYLGYNPIPLTPEVLEKAGFEWETTEKKHLQFDLPEQDINQRHISFLYLEGECKMLQYYMDDYFDGYFETKPPLYVHQLQNLYHAITQEELTINLCTATTQNGDL